MPVRRMLALATSVALLVSGCTTRSDSEPKPSKDRACRARGALIAEVNSTGPDLFVLSRRRLEETLLRRARYLKELSTATTGALRDDLQAEGAFRNEVRRRLLDAWGVEDGVALKDRASAAGFTTVREYLLRDEPSVGGRRLRSSELDWLARRNDLRLGVLCAAIQPIRADDGERPGPLPADVIAIDLDDHRLVRIDSRTRRQIRISGPPGWAVSRGAATSPDGTQIAFVAENHDEGRIDVFVAPLQAPDQSRPLTSQTDNAGCFSWAPAGDQIVASTGFGRPSHRLQRVDLSGRRTDVGLSGVDPDAFDCASFLNDSELLVETGKFEREDAVIQLVSADGGQLHPFLAIKDCGVINPNPSPAGGLVFFLAVCADVGRSGLYQARADGSGIRQLVAGIVGVFSVSRDGRWVVFSYMEPDGDGRNPALYAVDLTTRSFLHVAKPGSSWPTWGG